MTTNITVQPSRDLAFFDRVVNTPEVYRHIADETTPACGQLSMSAAVARRENVFLEVRVGTEPAGFFALLCRAPGVYEVHTNLLPRCRGARAVRAAQLGMDWMFLNTDANLLVSFAWDTEPAAAWFARISGMREDWRRLHPNKVFGQTVQTTFFSISQHEWVRAAWPRYREAGQKFHKQLFDQQGFDNHAEDPNHDGMLGLVLSMGTGGQPHKAEAVYNRWAVVAGYAPACYLGQRGEWYGLDISNAVVEVDREFNVSLIERRASCL